MSVRKHFEYKSEEIPVCECGHTAHTHLDGNGRCQQYFHLDKPSISKQCSCPQFRLEQSPEQSADTREWPLPDRITWSDEEKKRQLEQAHKLVTQITASSEREKKRHHEIDLFEKILCALLSGAWDMENTHGAYVRGVAEDTCKLAREIADVALGLERNAEDK